MPKVSVIHRSVSQLTTISCMVTGPPSKSIRYSICPSGPQEFLTDMPTLKQLTCHIEWAPSNTAFREYGVIYGDGVVESHIAIPDGSTPFTIKLESDGFIAPGLAMFVFTDGVYQCNRHRCDLQISDKAEVDNLSTMVNFRVRQKEEYLPDGSWIGRHWRFEPLNVGKVSC